MKKVKVLVLGNSTQINRIDFDKLDPSIITIGVNRIWLKYFPTYLYFNDYPIVSELLKSPEILAKLQTSSTIVSSDCLFRAMNPIPQWVAIHQRCSSTSKSFPDSISNAISIISKEYLNHLDCTFYIAGVPLKWSEPSHFWKELAHDSSNKYTESWYAPRFRMMYNNINRLKNNGYKFVSVTPDSMLNTLIRYENIENLYVKARL